MDSPYWEKYLSPTLARDKAKLEFISEGQPSPIELAFGVKLGLSHYYMIYWARCEGVYWKKYPSLTSAKDRVKLEFTSEEQPSPNE